MLRSDLLVCLRLRFRNGVEAGQGSRAPLLSSSFFYLSFFFNLPKPESFGVFSEKEDEEKNKLCEAGSALTGTLNYLPTFCNFLVPVAA